MKMLKQSLSIVVSFSLIFNQFLYAADLPIEVDKNAAAKHQASLDKAPNGVQIVNIVNPNSNGMSHNKFKEYNVNPSGLILNNSKKVVNTKLGGYISYNPNLTNNAKMILNEVTGTNKSLLRGYSEVAGAKADVIVANPNGITVNGGGFINTNKATLTTGRPYFLNGFVNGFDINSGNILIEGDGFNTTNIDKVELYSKALQINAKFYANNLKAVTGNNKIDLAGNVTSNGTVESGVSIDSSLLGGIYANRIELVSTNKGVGVNLPPEVYAQDSLSLTSDGLISLKIVNANNNIDITSNSSSIETNKLFADSIKLDSKESIVNNDMIVSTSKLDIKSKNLINKNLIITGVDKDLNYINDKKANLLIDSTNITNTDASIISQGNIDITSGIFTSDNGNVNTTNGNIKFKTNSLLVENSKITSSNDLTIDVMNDLILDSTNTIEALNDLTLNVSSMTNNTILKANNNLNMTATNIFTNNATGELRAKNIDLTIDELINKGLISSLQNMTLKTTSLTNTGGISSLNNDNNGSELSIYSDNLTNYNTIFSNDNINLYIKNDLTNKTDSAQASVDYARIMANNYLNIQGNDSKTLRTQNITNDKAIISTLKNDINIYSDNFTNIGTIPELEDLGTTVESTGGSDMMAGKTTCYNGNSHCESATTSWWMRVVGFRGVETSVWNNFMNKYPVLKTLSDGRGGTWANMYNDGGHESEETWTIALVEKTGQKLKENQDLVKGQVISANNLNIDSTNITNEYSLLKANNNITLDGTNLYNIGAKLIEKQLFKLRYYKCGGDRCSGQESLMSIQTHTESVVTGTVPSVISAGNDVTGNLSSLLNESIKDTTTTVSFSDIDTKLVEKKDEAKKQEYTLPTNDYGLFITTQKTATQKYLIESNPLYASYNNFIGSDYMLGKLNYKPENTIRRLGDARYENQLVREAILKKTGVSRGINIDDNSEYLRLMNNAITLSSQLNLEVGTGPTKEQLANLKEDIVWLEERIVNNEPVLVPIVYLASDYNQAAGIQAGGEIKLNIKDKVVNSGDMKSKGNLTITSKSITNDSGDIKSDALVNLTSQNDLVNKNGASIVGDSVKLVSTEGSVINDRFYKKVNEGSSNDRFTYTLVGKRSNIESKTGDVNIEAKKDIKNLASNIKSGKSVYLKSTDGNIDLKTKEIEESYNFVRSSDKYSKGKKIRHEQSGIVAGENIVIDSGKQANIEAANLNANNQISINAKDDVNVTAVNDLDYTNVKNKIKKSWGRSISSQDMKYKEKVVSSNINAKDISIKSDKDINLEAVNINAKENKIADAGGTLNIYAKEYKEGELHQSSKSSFGGLIKSEYKYEKNNLKIKASEITAKNMILDAKQINIQASKIKADEANITTNILNLISSKESLYENEFSNKGGILTATIENKGKIKETIVPATIEVNNKLIFNQKDLTDQLSSDNLIKTLSSQGNLTAEQINLVKQVVNDKQWHTKTTTLSGVGSLIIQAIVTYFTAGAGTGLSASITKGISNVALKAATQAAIKAVVAQATTQLVSGAITGNGLKLDLKAITKGAITAGVLSYANGLVDSSMGLQNVKVADMSTAQQFEKGVANTVVKSGVNSALYGTDFKDGLKTGLVTDISNVGFKLVGDTSMQQYLGKDNQLFKDGGLGKVALHSLVGGATAALQGKDVTAGMASAGVNELASPLLEGMNNSTQQIISGVIGGLTAGLVGGESQISTGQTIAQSGTEYNRQLHQDEIKFIKGTISKFKSINKDKTLIGREIDYSDSKAQRLLMTAAKYMVDETSQNQFNDNTKYVNQNEFSKAELQTAINYLKSSSNGLAFVDTYKESMLGQKFFTSTPEQFKDSSWTPDNITGLGDQGIGPFVPVGRVGQTLGTGIKEISPSVFKSGKILVGKTGQVYDDIGRKVYIKQQEIPVVKHFGADEINDIFNESMPATTKIGQLYGTGVGIGSKLYQMYINSQNGNNPNE